MGRIFSSSNKLYKSDSASSGILPSVYMMVLVVQARFVFFLFFLTNCLIEILL